MIRERLLERSRELLAEARREFELNPYIIAKYVSKNMPSAKQRFAEAIGITLEELNKLAADCESKMGVEEYEKFAREMSLWGKE